MATIQFIVRSLNAAPFSFTPPLTLMSFDKEKTPIELLRVLGTILKRIDEKSFAKGVYPVDDPEAVGQETLRVLSFLGDLRYPVVCDLNKKAKKTKEGKAKRETYAKNLSSGHRETIYAIMRFLLEDVEKHKLRAYLAHYLKPVQIPQEVVRTNKKLRNLFQKYTETQQEFSRAHKHFLAQQRETEANGGIPDAAELRKHKEQVQHEKQQLKEKIAHLKTKTKKIEGFQRLLNVTSKLRRCQEEESKNQERVAYLRTQIGNLVQVLQARETTLRDWQNIAQRPASEIMDHAQSERRQAVEMAQDTLPNEIADLREQIQQVRSFICWGWGGGERGR